MWGSVRSAGESGRRYPCERKSQAASTREKRCICSLIIRPTWTASAQETYSARRKDSSPETGRHEILSIFLTSFLRTGVKESEEFEHAHEPAGTRRTHSTTTALMPRLRAAECRCCTGRPICRDGTQVAVKVPHPEMEADPVLFERFKREEEIGRLLDHPGVVKTFDGEERSRVYMVIEWVDGRLLRSILNEEKQLACGSGGEDHVGNL